MSGPDPRPPRAREPAPPTGLTADQIARWADRVADGRDEFPADLAEPDRSALVEAVRGRVRDRLVRLVARAIAGRLVRTDDRPPSEEAQPC